MKKRLIINDIVNNKLLSISTAIFMAVSALLFALTCFLLMGLLGAIDVLMTDAETPDFLQMHSGDINEQVIAEFADANEAVKDYQVMDFLNLDNASIFIGDYSLSDSTQDNGVIVQSEKFDFLVDIDNHIISVDKGDIYVPVTYKQQYAGIAVGDTVRIGDVKFYLKGFLRDSQMNSMMSSSKRFLVCKEDFEALFPSGSNEYLIEFLLKDGADTSAFEAAYVNAGLPANGPAITKPLIKIMNALSDGMVFLVIFLVSIVMLLISILCIRFSLLAKLTSDRREIGMLKAVGISRKDIRSIYFVKFLVLALAGAAVGIVAAIPCKALLQKNLKELYGLSDNAGVAFFVALAGVTAALSILLLSVSSTIRKTEKISCVEALVGDDSRDNRRKSLFLVVFVVTAGVFLMCVPRYLYKTISSESFVTYMGIGSSDIRMDLRLSDDMLDKTAVISDILAADSDVEKYVSLVTKNYPVKNADGTVINLNIEQGNHAGFPVSYSEGGAPEADTQIALSILSAEEMGVTVGDSIEVLVDEAYTKFTVSGIYSDITNGGKTAKSAYVHDNAKVMWSTFYVKLGGNPIFGSSVPDKKMPDNETWIANMESRLTGQDINVKIYDIHEFVKAINGQTIAKVKLASVAAFIVSLVIIFVVVFLFVRLMIARDRYDISLKRAIGFSKGMVTGAYMKSFLISAVLGIVIGVAAGKFLGEILVGLVLSSLGAGGFKFVADIPVVMISVPVFTVLTVAVSTYIALKEVSNIKGYECCLGRE